MSITKEIAVYASMATALAASGCVNNDSDAMHEDIERIQTERRGECASMDYDNLGPFLCETHSRMVAKGTPNGIARMTLTTLMETYRTSCPKEFNRPIDRAMQHYRQCIRR